MFTVNYFRNTNSIYIRTIFIEYNPKIENQIKNQIESRACKSQSNRDIRFTTKWIILKIWLIINTIKTVEFGKIIKKII